MEGEIGVCSPNDAADLRLLYIKTNKQFPPRKELQKGFSGCDALSLISGVYLVGI